MEFSQGKLDRTQPENISCIRHLLFVLFSSFTHSFPFLAMYLKQPYADLSRRCNLFMDLLPKNDHWMNGPWQRTAASRYIWPRHHPSFRMTRQFHSHPQMVLQSQDLPRFFLEWVKFSQAQPPTRLDPRKSACSGAHCPFSLSNPSIAKVLYDPSAVFLDSFMS